MIHQRILGYRDKVYFRSPSNHRIFQYVFDEFVAKTNTAKPKDEDFQDMVLILKPELQVGFRLLTKVVLKSPAFFQEQVDEIRRQQKVKRSKSVQDWKVLNCN